MRSKKMLEEARRLCVIQWRASSGMCRGHHYTISSNHMSFKCVVIIHNKDVNGSLPVFACWSTYRGLVPKEEVLRIFHSAHCPPLHGPKSTLKMKHMPAQSACASMSIPTPNDYAMPAPKQKFPPIIHSTIYIFSIILTVHISANRRNIDHMWHLTIEYNSRSPDVTTAERNWSNPIRIYHTESSAKKGEPKHGRQQSSREFS